MAAKRKAPQRRPAQKQTAATAGPNKTGAASKRGGAAANEPAGPDDSKSQAKRLFDLRWLIAVMFVIYGIVLSITGLLDSQAEIHKASGVRINLWTGIGMFVVGLVFAAWARWRPLRPDE